MPLSEHEERILAEIERQLADDDPRFFARARRRQGMSRRTRRQLAGVLAVLGVIGVVSLTFSIVFGAIGMVLLLAAVVLAATAASESAAASPPSRRE
ncbi:MAG: DUF3040 domain-containing protein [Nitriliruptoraceae bacterium]